MSSVFCAMPDGGAGEISSVYCSTGEPGVVGVTHATFRLCRRRRASAAAGVSGRASGRAISDGPDGSESPTRFVAITVKLYSTLFVSPSSVQVVAAHCFL